MTDTSLVGIVIALLSLAGVIVSVRHTNQGLAKLQTAQAELARVSANSSTVTDALKIVDTYREEVGLMSTRIVKLEKAVIEDQVTINRQAAIIQENTKEIAVLRAQVEILTQQVIAMGGTPITAIKKTVTTDVTVIRDE